MVPELWGASIFITGAGSNMLTLRDEHGTRRTTMIYTHVLKEHNRFRFWGEVPELEGRILHVITLADKSTIHNAFPDRRFRK